MKEEIKSKYRLSKNHTENTDHLNSEFLILKNNDHLMRYDKVCAHLRYSMWKAPDTEVADKWYTNTHTHTHTHTKPICKYEDVTVS